MTESQESTAAQEAKREEQEAKGKLNLQNIDDDCEAAKKEKELLDIKAEALKIEQSGSGEAKAQATANAAEIQIQMKARVEEATLLEKAEKVSFAARLRDEEAEGQALLDYTSEKYQLVESFHENMSQIEFNKFSAMIKAIGAETLQSIALSGPELQVSLLQGLGLNSTLIMDGANPLNLFNTAQKMIAKTDSGASARPRQQQQQQQQQITGAAGDDYDDDY